MSGRRSVGRSIDSAARTRGGEPERAWIAQEEQERPGRRARDASQRRPTWIGPCSLVSPMVNLTRCRTCTTDTARWPTRSHLRITADAALAEDVVQDAFRCSAQRRPLREGSGVKTWLLSIVHHRAVDAVRRRRPTTELPEAARPAAGQPDAARHLAGGRRQPSIGPRSRPPRRRCRTCPARGHRAGLLRRADPGRDRRPGPGAIDGEEPDPAGLLGDAARARG